MISQSDEYKLVLNHCDLFSIHNEKREKFMEIWEQTKEIMKDV